MSLDKIFGLYTILFLGVTILIGIGERLGLFSNQMIGWLFMALSLAIYVVIGVLTRTSNPDQYYVAGRNVPAFYNGMATGSDWMSAASFISMAGALSIQGFSGLAYVMGWTGGYLLLAVFLGPYLRQFGAYTIPDFLGARYGGNTARVIGVVAAIACSLMYLIAQVTGVGFIVARFIGIDFNVGVFLGLIGVLFCSVLGGMRSVTWTQVAQYIILIISYLVPVVYLSWQIFSIPIPQLTYGQLLQQNNARAIEVTRDPVERETRALWRKEADEANARIKAGGLPEAEVERLKATAALATRQATAPAAGDDVRFGRYLTVPTGIGMWNFLALTFCLMVGTAGLPHILTRYYTAPSVRQARTTCAWALLCIFLLYFTAPAYAAFARFALYTRLVGSKISELPSWVTLWKPAGLFDVVDKNGDGIVHWADFVVKSSDFVVLATPEIAGLPFVITGLVMAGGLAAALSTADGLLLTIANAISHDLYYNVIDPRASLVQATHHHQGTAGGDRHRGRLDRDLPPLAHRGAGGVGLQPGRRVVLPGARHGHLVEACERHRGQRRHDRRTGGDAVLHGRQPLLRTVVVGDADDRLRHLRAAGRVPDHLDRVAPYGAAASGGPGARDQRAVSEVRAGHQGRSARPRPSRSAGALIHPRGGAPRSPESRRLISSGSWASRGSASTSG